VAERPGDAKHPRVVFSLMLGHLAQPSVGPNVVFEQFSEWLVAGELE
jgi:D-alanyl-D-alanine carboxypeptidase/D-alanyl-D-alanine-endopeptidase (penicillin-binding protein 4)